MEITHIEARQILDSRGNPTVEADVWLSNKVFGRASVPSGASTGEHEAHELRDGGAAYGGKGVTKAVENIESEIAPRLRGMRADDQFMIDRTMIELDGTPNKSRLGANALLAVSLACSHAAAKARGILLYAHINDIAGNPSKSLPMPMMNVLNGGAHASDASDIQECMIVPHAAETFADAIRIGSEIFHNLRSILHDNGYATTVGDEGGFAPILKNGNNETLELLSAAVNKAGYRLGNEVSFALDVAASEFYEGDGQYHLKTDKITRTDTEMVAWYQELLLNHPIVSIEDGLAEDDWHGWKKLTQQMGSIQLVGDDLLVTNTKRLARAIKERCGNAILIKPNQIGTLTETLQAIHMAKQAGWNTIISHRSGETEDVTIAHIAIGTGAGQIKTGSLSRSERTAKHNELMRIERIDPTISLYNPFNQN